MKKNTLTRTRVEEQLLPLYVEPRADGTRVTDQESFSTDIIADVLIWAHTNGENIDDIARSALDHARYEIDNNPEQQ